MAAHQPRPVPNFAFISFANLPRDKGEEGREKERKNRLHIYAAHSSLSLSLPLTFSASFLTFGKCQRKNCAQNEAQFTALVVCKLSHLQCAPRSFPIPPTLLIPSPSHPVSIMIACSRFLLFHVASDIFKLHPQIYIVCLPFPPITFLPSPYRPSSKHWSMSVSLFRFVFPEIVAFWKFTFTISCIFTNLHICWSSFLLGVIISFDTLLAERRRRRRRSRVPLKWGVKCHWQVWAYRLCSGGSVIIGVCVGKTSTLITDSEKVAGLICL